MESKTHRCCIVEVRAYENQREGGFRFFPLYGDWCSLDVFDYSVPEWVFCGDGHACQGAFEVFVFVSEVASYIYVLEG